MTELHLVAGTAGDATHDLVITPESADWEWSGLRTLTLGAGATHRFDTGDTEVCVLPLSGDYLVDTGDDRFELAGRESVFERVSDFAYVGIGSSVEVTAGRGGELAICSSKATVAYPARYGPASGVAVEVRGGGQATRQITNFMSPETWQHADKLMCVEVLTPDGNWSSYPPHKHDDSPECEVNNEEIYYFRIGDAGTTNYSADGFGMHRTYTGVLPNGELEIDETVTVRDADAFLVPRGYHGPCIAAPGYPMYYLNVLSGPGGERSMAFCDDPAHHWVRDTFTGDNLDPRCPMTTATGPQF